MIGIDWLLGWWDERCDRIHDERSGRDDTSRKWRWWLAEFVDRRRPNSCWASGGAEFALGWSNRLTADNTSCVMDAQKNGSCWCAKIVRSDLADDYTAAGTQFRLLVPPTEVRNDNQ